MKLYQNPDVLRELYWKEGLSSLKIAEILGVNSRTVRNWLKRFDIPRRSLSEAGTKYPKTSFSGDLKEKAYMLGLRAGDFYAQRNFRLIRIKTSTTHLAQIELVKEVFGKYNSHIAVNNVFDKRFGIEKWQVHCDLDGSFEFLLEKVGKIPEWILDNDEFFFHFLAGYADCEGHFRIWESHGKFVRFSFILTSTNLTILEQIKNKLQTMNILSHLYLNTKAGTISKGGIKSNKNAYNLVVYKKGNIITLVSELLWFSHHQEKIWKISLILESVGKKWTEVEDKLTELRNRIKKTVTSKEVNTQQLDLQIKEPPYS